MPDSLHLADFLEPLSLAELSNDEPYHDGQIGKDIAVYEDEMPVCRNIHWEGKELQDARLTGCVW